MFSSSVSSQLVGKSPQMTGLRQRFDRAGRHDVPVLLYGERGTGKELAARAIHAASARAGRPFVAVNCGALPSSLLESELFGHARGAFTGATEARKGLFVEADGGTLFLDEINSLPAAAQAALLRVLQEGEVRPVGATRAVRVDVRVIAATNGDLATACEAGTFRADLYDRLNVYDVTLPPLRAREGDVRMLAEHFLSREGKRLSPAALAAVEAYSWPGNVRELQNAMRRASIDADGDEIGLDALPVSVARAVPAVAVAAAVVVPASAPAVLPVPLPQTGTLAEQLAACERALVERALVASGGNRTHAARALGVERTSLLRIMKRHSIEVAVVPRERPSKVVEVEAAPQSSSVVPPVVVEAPASAANRPTQATPPPAIEVVDATPEPEVPTCAIASAPLAMDPTVPRAPSRRSSPMLAVKSPQSPAAAPSRPRGIQIGDKLLRRGVTDRVYEAARFDDARPDAIGVRSPMSSRIQFLPRREFMPAPTDHLR